MRDIKKFFTYGCVTVATIGCGDDQTVTTMASETTVVGTTEVDLTTSSVPTGELTTSDETIGESQNLCAEPSYPLENVPFAVADPEVVEILSSGICDSIDSVPMMLTVYIYRPEILPNEPLPFVLMTNGVGQYADGYAHVLNPLAARGFVVASVQTISADIGARADVMKCVLRWLRKTWSVENGVIPNCDVVLMGHSKGGEAAWRMGNEWANIPWWDINLEGVDMRVAALIGIAPRYDGSSAYNSTHAIPYLGIMGSTDEDVTGHGIIAYDDMVRESKRSAGDPAKLFLWPYDIPHGAFGGKGNFFPPPGSPLTSSEYSAKAKAVLSTFVPAFVDLVVLGDSDANGIFTGSVTPAELTPGGNTDWWSYLEPAFSELGEGPVILRDFVVDQRTEPEIRMVVDDFESGDDKFTTDLSIGALSVGEQADLANGTMVKAFHRENVLRVRWGDSEPGGTISWELDEGESVDLSEKSFFSMRVGQEFVLDGDPSCGLAMGDPRANAIELIVRLEDDLGVIADVELGPIVQQHVQEVVSPEGGVSFCAGAQFMPTLRIPMNAFCSVPGFDVESVVSVTVEFPNLMYGAGVYMDTLEFTGSSLDASSLCL